MIPIGDFDSLRFRWDSFVQYVNLCQENMESELPNNILAEYAKNQELDDKQNVFLSFLYGMTYSSISTPQMFCEWVEDEEKMNNWWHKNKERLHFQNDKRYIKHMDQYVPALMSYLKNEDEIVEAVLHQPFLSARKVCLGKIRFFGEHALYLMYDVLTVLYGKNFGSIPDRIEWETNGPTVAEGMYRLFGWDEKLPIRKFGVDPRFIPELDNHAKYIANQLRLGMGELETNLCAFAKLFKQTRYFGYYKDRHLGDLLNYTGKAPQKFLDLNWKFREDRIDKSCLGEFNNWTGIRKEKCKEFVKYGKL